jgi:hypothetical protein
MAIDIGVSPFMETPFFWVNGKIGKVTMSKPSHPSHETILVLTPMVTAIPSHFKKPPKQWGPSSE